MITCPTSLSKSSFSANSSSDNCSASSILACSSLRTRSASEPRSGFFGTWTQTKCQVYTSSVAASVLYPHGSTNLLRAILQDFVNLYRTMFILQDYTVYMHQNYVNFTGMYHLHRSVSFMQDYVHFTGKGFTDHIHLFAGLHQLIQDYVQFTGLHQSKQAYVHWHH